MKVKLTYFKRSTGKYYSEGEFDTNLVLVHMIFIKVRKLHNAGIYPGLCDGIRDTYFTLVEIPDHAHGYPHLIIPKDKDETESN